MFFQIFCLGKKLRSGKIVNLELKNGKSNDQIPNKQSSKVLRNGKRLPSPNRNQNPTATQTNQQTSKKNKLGQDSEKTNLPHPNLPSHPIPTSPTGITASKIKHLWTDLKEPLSYSGNSSALLNKIKAFK